MIRVDTHVYVIVHKKTDLFAHFVKIELLVHVSLECAFNDELIGAFDAAIRCSITKL